MSKYWDSSTAWPKYATTSTTTSSISYPTFQSNDGYLTPQFVEQLVDDMHLKFSIKEQNYQKQQYALMQKVSELQNKLYIYEGRLDCPFNVRITNAGDYIRGPKRK